MNCEKGLVRRLDELGRVVIPKELRQSLRIENGNMLEFFYKDGTELIVKKYEPIREISSLGEKLLYSLRGFLDVGFLLCDMQKVVAVQNHSKKDTMGKKLFSSFVEKLKFTHTPFDCEKPIDAVLKENNKIFPIVSQGIVSGCVIVTSKNQCENCVSISVSTIVQILSDYLSE